MIAVTLNQIQERVSRIKPCSRVQLFRYLKSAGVKPIGRRQRPQLYPANAPRVVLDHLGFGKIVSLATLKAVRDKAQKARGK